LNAGQKIRKTALKDVGSDKKRIADSGKTLHERVPVDGDGLSS